MKTPNEYAAAGGLGCPICGKNPVNLSEGSRTNEILMVRRRCLGCGTDWTETAKVTGYIDLDPGPPWM